MNDKISYEELINKIKINFQGFNIDQEKTISFINSTIKNYAQILGYSELEILTALEKDRKYSAANYYQEANFPYLDNKIEIYDTVADFCKKYPSHKYICPHCNGISTDPSVCNSGKRINKEVCDWKSFGLFHCLGKGLRLIIKSEFLENPTVFEIFMPIEKLDNVMLGKKIQNFMDGKNEK